MIEVDVEIESASGHVWAITASGQHQPADQDVGIPWPFFELVDLYWTKTGAPLSKTAFNFFYRDQYARDEIDAALGDAIYGV